MTGACHLGDGMNIPGILGCSIIRGRPYVAKDLLEKKNTTESFNGNYVVTREEKTRLESKRVRDGLPPYESEKHSMLWVITKSSFISVDIFGAYRIR